MHGYKLSRKQSEYILNADARYNLKIGAVRSGKSFVDIVHMIPQRLITVADDPGLNLFLGVSKETIERNVLQPMREQYTDELVGTINNRNMPGRVKRIVTRFCERLMSLNEPGVDFNSLQKELDEKTGIKFVWKKQ